MSGPTRRLPCKVKIKGGDRKKQASKKNEQEKQQGTTQQPPAANERKKSQGKGKKGGAEAKSPKSDSSFSKRGAVPTRGGKNSSNLKNTVGFHRVPVQGVTSSEGTLIRRYLGSLCSL
jgi:hypothetical protein